MREVATETAATVITRLTGAPPDQGRLERRDRRGAGRAADRLREGAMEEPGFFAEPRNWVLIAFILFFVLFGKKLWAALAGMLDDRAAKVRAELEEAARLRQEAEAMLRDAEKRRAEALREAQALIDGAKAEADACRRRSRRRRRGFGQAARADGDGPHRRRREGRGGRGAD